jgi:hypothetical protein
MNTQQQQLIQAVELLEFVHIHFSNRKNGLRLRIFDKGVKSSLHLLGVSPADVVDSQDKYLRHHCHALLVKRCRDFSNPRSLPFYEAVELVKQSPIYRSFRHVKTPRIVEYLYDVDYEAFDAWLKNVKQMGVTARRDAVSRLKRAESYVPITEKLGAAYIATLEASGGFNSIVDISRERVRGAATLFVEFANSHTE